MQKYDLLLTETALFLSLKDAAFTESDAQNYNVQELLMQQAAGRSQSFSLLLECSFLFSFCHFVCTTLTSLYLEKKTGNKQSLFFNCDFIFSLESVHLLKLKQKYIFLSTFFIAEDVSAALRPEILTATCNLFPYTIPTFCSHSNYMISSHFAGLPLCGVKPNNDFNPPLILAMGPKGQSNPIYDFHLQPRWSRFDVLKGREGGGEHDRSGGGA